MEFFRRLFFLLCICTALWLVFYAPLEPLVSIRPADFASRYEKEKPLKRNAGSLLEDNGTHSASNLKEFIARETAGRLITVEGKEWEFFFRNVAETHEGRASKKEWKRRASPEYRGAGLYFSAAEAPVRELRDKFSSGNQTIYLALRGNGKPGYLELTYREYSHDKFHIGSGLSDYPDPPSWLFYPYRKFSIWIAIGGFVLYFLLPKNKKQKDSIRFSSWFITGNDLAFSLLLIAPSFAAPFAIMGGSVQVFFTEGIFLLPFLWPIALIGTWGFVFVMPRFASFEMEFHGNGFRVVSEKGERSYAFTDMRCFQPVTFKRPRWLIMLSWLAFLSGRRGGLSTLFLSTLENAGIGISLKDDSVLYINTSNPVGMDVLNRKTEDIVNALRAAGVEERSESLVIRTLGLEPAGIKKLS